MRVILTRQESTEPGADPGAIGELSERAGDQSGGVVGSRLIPHEHGLRLPEASSFSTHGCEAIERVIGPRAFGIPPAEASSEAAWTEHMPF